MLLTYESTNFIYGTSSNPWNLKKSAGGSSGGEAGLLASRCSPFGIGSDIGGSIRSPCSWNGIVGFKHGNDRLKIKGSFPRSYQSIGASPVEGIIGPMGKFVEDSVLYFRTILNEENLNKLPMSRRGP